MSTNICSGRFFSLVVPKLPGDDPDERTVINFHPDPSARKYVSFYMIARYIHAPNVYRTGRRGEQRGETFPWGANKARGSPTCRVPGPGRVAHVPPESAAQEPPDGCLLAGRRGDLETGGRGKRKGKRQERRFGNSRVRHSSTSFGTRLIPTFRTRSRPRHGALIIPMVVVTQLSCQSTSL